MCPSKRPSRPQAAIYGFSSQTYGQCLPSPALLPAAPALLLQQLGLAGALSGLVLRTATPWLLPGSLPGQKSLLCHRKQKLLYLSPDQLLHVPQSLFKGAKPKQVRIWLGYYFGLS